MNRTFATRLLSTLFLLTLFITFPVAAQQTWRTNDRVLAEWNNSAWYTGKIASPCDDGYQILYDDGDTKCCALFEIIKDEAPAANEVRIGTLVLAAWGSAYYPAKVTAIDGSEYSVIYFDGDKGSLALEQLRVLSGEIAKRNDFDAGEQAGAAETMVLSTDIEIWWGGSRWATVETDGAVWIGGSWVGEIESDGNVWISGSNEGEVEADGDIWFGGSSVGEIESDGDFWRGGSKIAEIESDGAIYLHSSRWGEVDPFNGSYEEMRVIAAVLAFFAEEFGFYE